VFPQPRPAGAIRVNTLRTLSFAAFLACSWTWCIGMFLPVLLVRDFGVWGFVVFAVPNVLGAAAMGFVLADPARAAAVREAHKPAAVAFSLVTVAFQVYFLMWLSVALHDAYAPGATPQPGRSTAYLVLIFAGAFVPAIATRLLTGPHATRFVRITTALAWVASACIFAWLMSGGELRFLPSSWPPTALSSASIPASLSRDLLLLAPVVAFGFVFCPYLDLTFLRAASSQTPRQNRVSFALGFGLMFLAMIVFTLGYAWALMPMAFGVSLPIGRPPVLDAVVAHIWLQALFTVFVHVRELTSSALSRRALVTACIVLLAFTVVWLIVGTGSLIGPLVAGLTGGEVVYRLFMSFYGLVFPAYVWICMIPTRDGHSGLGGAEGVRKLIALIVACVLAAPCYWMGFIERQELWLVPGLAVVLLARVIGKSPGR
jgi:hypothetical protein